MICPECGQSIAGETKICPHCGHVLRVSGLRVRRTTGGNDMATAKRSAFALTPTHPRLPLVPAAAITVDTTDPWQSEWMGTAKRPLSPATADTHDTRRYLLPGVIAAMLLLACVGIAFVLHGALFSSPAVPVKAPASVTKTSVPTATTDATNTIVPTATVAGYTPPRHVATATVTPTPKIVPTATPTSPVIIVTTTAHPDPTATAVATKPPTPKSAP